MNKAPLWLMGYPFNANFQIVDSVAKGGQQPANGFVSKGLTGPNGVGDWTDANGPKKDGSGYYSIAKADCNKNVDTAIETIKGLGFHYDEATEKFTDVPTMEYLYNTSFGHQAIAQAIQTQFEQVGIKLTLVSQEWATFLDTRKAGHFDVARNGWLCDYNDPISMLDMWVTQSGNNDCQLGK